MTFPLDAGSGYDIVYTLSSGQQGSGRDDWTGEIKADVMLDAEGRVNRFRMTGGAVHHSDGTLTVPLDAVYQLDFISAGVIAFPTATENSGWVSPFSNMLFNEGSAFVFGEGTLTTRILAGGQPVYVETRDYSQDPETSVLLGSTTISSSLLENGGWWKRVRINFHHERDTARTYPVNPAITLVPPGTTYTVTETGTVTSNSVALFPGDDFVGWAQTERAVTPGSLSDRDASSGQPLLVMYALRAGGGAWQVPVSFAPAAGTLTLGLPAEGLRTPLRWEIWTGTAGQTWVPLTGTPLAGGITPAGTSGPLVLPLPLGNKGFVRASVPLPTAD